MNIKLFIKSFCFLNKHVHLHVLLFIYIDLCTGIKKKNLIYMIALNKHLHYKENKIQLFLKVYQK